MYNRAEIKCTPEELVIKLPKKMELNDTINLMNNSDYKKRMINRLVEAAASKDKSVIEKAMFPFAYMKLVEGVLLNRRYKK